MYTPLFLLDQRAWQQSRRENAKPKSLSPLKRCLLFKAPQMPWKTGRPYSPSWRSPRREPLWPLQGANFTEPEWGSARFRQTISVLSLSFHPHHFVLLFLPHALTSASLFYFSFYLPPLRLILLPGSPGSGTSFALPSLPPSFLMFPVPAMPVCFQHSFSTYLAHPATVVVPLLASLPPLPFLPTTSAATVVAPGMTVSSTFKPLLLALNVYGSEWQLEFQSVLLEDRFCFLSVNLLEILKISVNLSFWSFKQTWGLSWVCANKPTVCTWLQCVCFVLFG